MTTGLNYHRARWYGPAVGHFISMDSFRGDDANPITLHKYLYANCDPILRRDMNGAQATIAEVSLVSDILSDLISIKGPYTWSDSGEKSDSSKKGKDIVSVGPTNFPGRFTLNNERGIGEFIRRSTARAWWGWKNAIIITHTDVVTFINESVNAAGKDAVHMLGVVDHGSNIPPGGLMFGIMPLQLGSYKLEDHRLFELLNSIHFENDAYIWMGHCFAGDILNRPILAEIAKDVHIPVYGNTGADWGGVWSDGENVRCDPSGTCIVGAPYPEGGCQVNCVTEIHTGTLSPKRIRN